MESSAKLYNVLLNKTIGEANAVVRRTTTDGILGWKRLVSTLNPRTLASGIKAISAAINPPKVTQSMKADHIMDEWETKLAKLSTEYGQQLSFKIKVAVLYSMMPKGMQERITDACSVAWDQTSEADASTLFEKVKSQLRNLAKARREMAGPRPMEVDRVAAEYGGGGWWMDGTGESAWGYDYENEDLQCPPCDAGEQEMHVQMVGKGGGKKGGKGGFVGSCWLCGEYGHSQAFCPYGKGKNKGKGKDFIKGMGKDKGYGKDNTWGKGKGKDHGYGKGYGEGKGAGMRRACFTCGSTEHLMRYCPPQPGQRHEGPAY